MARARAACGQAIRVSRLDANPHAAAAAGPSGTFLGTAVTAAVRRAVTPARVQHDHGGCERPRPSGSPGSRCEQVRLLRTKAHGDRGAPAVVAVDLVRSHAG